MSPPINEYVKRAATYDESRLLVARVRVHGDLTDAQANRFAIATGRPKGAEALVEFFAMMD